MAREGERGGGKVKWVKWWWKKQWRVERARRSRLF